MPANKPVVLGGTPTITDDHTAHCQWPLIEEDDLAAVTQVMQSGDISTHPVRMELETAYANKFKRQYAVSHNNGTSALLAAFFACELGQGDEVLVTSATWWASVSPMLWLGAVPVFCECETKRFGISVDDMNLKLTSKTRAIVVVHLWGMPSNMDEIQAFADEHGLKIIEDASHAHGASLHGQPCGSFGDVSVFSLQGDKLSPAGEGGVLLTDNYDFYERTICLGDVTRIYQLETPARRFAATSFGVKTRMAPLSAAVGLSQLNKLDKNNARRNSNIEVISKPLEEMGFDTYMGTDGYQRTYFEFLVKWTPECGIGIDALVQAVNAEGAQVMAPRYPMLHQQPFFVEGHWNSIARLENGLEEYDFSKVSLPVTQSESQLMIRLPSFSTASRDFLDQYIQAFRKVISNGTEIEKALG